MGCTSSKETTNPPTSTITDNSQQLINDHFRKWLKSNRPKADEYILNDIISTTQQTNNIDDYRPIVRKALDLLSERHDIKTTNKLNKLLQKEVSFASPKNIARTIDVLKQTAEKLRQGQILLDSDQQTTTTINGEKTSDNKHGQLSSGQPGIVLKEALEKARISFYKGKQAAIFANPNGGYDVRIIDENDDTLNHDGNLLRSIIVTEVKMRPKPTTTTLPQFTAPPPPPPPPPPSKLLDEHEIGDDFRRSIDAALKGLEAIYHTSPSASTEQTHEAHIDNISSSNRIKPRSEDNTIHPAEILHQGKAIRNINEEEQRAISQTDIQPKLVGAVDAMNDIMLDTIETTTKSQIGDPIPPTHYDTVEKLVRIKPNEDSVNQTKEHEENVVTKQTSSYSIGLTSTLPNKESSTLQQNVILNHENPAQSLISNEENLNKDQHNFNKQIPLDELTQIGLSNPNLPISSSKIEEEPIINHETSLKLPTPISQIIEEHNKTFSESSSIPPAVAPIDMNTTVKSPSHNVTYTQIIHSESQDGEQSRRFITESYDEKPSKDDDQTTSHTVVTKSEFSNHPSLGEKIMEQSVQVITVKVRNETTTTTIPSQTSENDISYDKQSVKNDVNTIDMTI